VVKKVHLAWISPLILVVIFLGWALFSRFDGLAAIHYRFEAPKHSEHHLTLTIPVKDYREYKERPRPSYENGLSKNEIAARVLAKYTAMATDPGDDAIIYSLVRQLEDEAHAGGLGELDKVRFVLKFVQSLTYTADNATTPGYLEYPRYPVETLFEQGGDCEDTSILLAAILTEMGYDVAIIFFEGFDHMGLGIYVPEEKMYGNSWIYQDGRRYWYLDTSGKEPMGWSPKPYDVTPAYLLPVGG
jgi:hypothetical protein